MEDVPADLLGKTQELPPLKSDNKVSREAVRTIEEKTDSALEEALTEDYANLSPAKRAELNLRLNSLADNLFVMSHTKTLPHEMRASIGIPGNNPLGRTIKEFGVMGLTIGEGELRVLAGSIYNMVNLAAKVTGGRKPNPDLQEAIEKHGSKVRYHRRPA